MRCEANPIKSLNKGDSSDSSDDSSSSFDVYSDKIKSKAPLDSKNPFPLAENRSAVKSVVDKKLEQTPIQVQRLSVKENVTESCSCKTYRFLGVDVLPTIEASTSQPATVESLRSAQKYAPFVEKKEGARCLFPEPAKDPPPPKAPPTPREIRRRRLSLYTHPLRRYRKPISLRPHSQDCIEYGYVITGFPTSGAEFELFEMMPTPPNRIIFMNADMERCKARILARAVDWCTGKQTTRGAQLSSTHPRDTEKDVEAELDLYFSEGVAEMRAAAGLSAWEIDSNQSIDQAQTKLQAAVMAAPLCDMKFSSPTKSNLEHARVD